jgi:hypothetical protein
VQSCHVSGRKSHSQATASKILSIDDAMRLFDSRSLIRRGAPGPGGLGPRLRRRLPFPDLGAVVSNDATDRRARHRMMTGHVPDDTAHRGTFQATLRAARAGQKADGSGYNQGQE